MSEKHSPKEGEGAEKGAEKSAKSEKKRFGCLKVFLLLVVLFFVAAHFATPGIVRNVANRILPDAVNTDAHLEKVFLNLFSGRAGIGGLSIQQPEGFEGEPLVELRSFSTSASLMGAIRRNPVIVNRVDLDHLTLRLIMNEDGVLNLTRLGDIEKEEPEDREVGDVPPIWVKKMVLSQIQILFKDQAQEWNLAVEDVHFELTDLRIANATGAEGPAEFHGRLQLVGPSVNAQLKLWGKVGMILPDQPDRVPPMQLALGLIGFDLDIVDPFLVRGARTALGGNGFDFILFMEIGEGEGPAEQSLYGSYAIGTNENHAYAGSLGGTLEHPELPFLNILGDVVGNQFGRITRLGGNVAEGGLEALRGAAETGATAVRGAADTVRGTAGGVLRTARGVVTLDREEVTGGIRDTTVGTVTNVAGTVTGTVSAVADTVGSTAGAALGHHASERWWDGVDERVALFEENAQSWFESRPFPGE
ncbi:MAG: hypothetical protein JJU29_16160 [Verrucomicrobia bacterium]|nr:hypothetical protein [Verrucomicrobiota bacterium]MCH8513586.1 hypothetical protein [Kiritimatiellia bacterium]